MPVINIDAINHPVIDSLYRLLYSILNHSPEVNMLISMLLIFVSSGAAKVYNLMEQ
jgi:hypothetical protein